MMFDIMYHPLVGADTENMDKVPTFCCPNEEMVKRGHKLYLEEIIPNRFRLCSSQPMTAKETSGFSIYCPRCGEKLKAISPPADGIRHGLFECEDCLANDPRGGHYPG